MKFLERNVADAAEAVLDLELDDQKRSLVIYQGASYYAYFISCDRVQLIPIDAEYLRENSDAYMDFYAQAKDIVDVLASDDACIDILKDIASQKHQVDVVFYELENRNMTIREQGAPQPERWSGTTFLFVEDHYEIIGE